MYKNNIYFDKVLWRILIVLRILWHLVRIASLFLL